MFPITFLSAGIFLMFLSPYFQYEKDEKKEWKEPSMAASIVSSIFFLIFYSIKGKKFLFALIPFSLIFLVSTLVLSWKKKTNLAETPGKHISIFFSFFLQLLGHSLGLANKWNKGTVKGFKRFGFPGNLFLFLVICLMITVFRRNSFQIFFLLSTSLPCLILVFLKHKKEKMKAFIIILIVIDVITIYRLLSDNPSAIIEQFQKLKSKTNNVDLQTYCQTMIDALKQELNSRDIAYEDKAAVQLAGYVLLLIFHINALLFLKKGEKESVGNENEKLKEADIQASKVVHDASQNHFKQSNV